MQQYDLLGDGDGHWPLQVIEVHDDGGVTVRNTLSRDTERVPADEMDQLREQHPERLRPTGLPDGHTHISQPIADELTVDHYLRSGEFVVRNRFYFGVQANRAELTHQDDRVLPHAVSTALLSAGYAVVADGRDANTIDALLAEGLTPTEAVDYHAVRLRGYSASTWASLRDRDQSSISESVQRAEAALEE